MPPSMYNAPHETTSEKARPQEHPATRSRSGDRRSVMALLGDLRVQAAASSWPSWPRLSTTETLLRLLLPSFVADLVWPEHRTTWKLHPTSYLDGLRGIASFLVFFCHYTEENFAPLTPTYGLDLAGNPAPSSSWLQLPFVRVLFSGRPMVHIFFVISGFVLSLKPLRELHARNHERCYSALSSSVFRRPFRLFGPCAVSTFLIMFLIQSGQMHGPPMEWGKMLSGWKDTMFHSVTWPWAWDADLRPGFDVHLWTIPIEFVHSMLLFLVILMLARVRLRVRQATTFALMVYCLCCGRWAGFEFLAGMFMADAYILQQAAAAAAAPRHRLLSPLARTSLHTFVVAAALYVGGWPNAHADKTPIIGTLLAWTPYPFATLDETAPQKFYFAIAAAFVVWSSGELGWLRRFLEGPFAQYCGRLSYAIYIVHGPVLIVCEHRGWIGFPAKPAQGTPGAPDYQAPSAGMGVRYYFPGDDPWQLTMCWAAGMLAIGPVAVWAADLFWRLVDVPIVKLARKVENLCLDNRPADPSLPRIREDLYGEQHPMGSISRC